MTGSTVSSSGQRWARVNHPAFLAGIVVLLLNDHVLKAEWPGTATAKLSDAAGLFLLGAIGFDLADRVARRSGLRVIVAVVIAAPFAAVNTNRHVAVELRDVVARVLDSVGPVLGWVPVIPTDGAGAVVVSDPSDLLMLPAVLLPLLLVARHPRTQPIVVSPSRSVPVA